MPRAGLGPGRGPSSRHRHRDDPGRRWKPPRPAGSGPPHRSTTMSARPASSRAGATFPDYVTQLVVGGHHLIADEPADLGGTDTGPTPEELLLAALAACT